MADKSLATSNKRLRLSLERTSLALRRISKLVSEWQPGGNIHSSYYVNGLGCELLPR